MGIYKPSQQALSAKAYGPSQPVPTDGRSFYYDEVNFVSRPYQSAAEVLSYLDTAVKRTGGFPIYINKSGVIDPTSHQMTGGDTEVYWFKDGTGPDNLVKMFYSVLPTTAGFRQNATLYVEKRFEGKAGVTVLATGITSTNTSYNNQLANAAVGDPNRPFPCIWSAQEAATALQVAGTAPKVTIDISNNYYVTVGSPTLTQNGNAQADASINEEPDIKVANVEADMYHFSLGRNGITYNFGNNSSIVNICKAYSLRLVWINSDPTNIYKNVPTYEQADKTRYDFKIIGSGEFNWLYGQNEGFRCTFASVMNYPNLFFTFHAAKVMINMWDSLNIWQFRQVDINVDKWYDVDCFFNIKNNFDWITAGWEKPTCHVTIRDRRRGRGLFTGLPPTFANDYWAGNNFQSKYGSTFLINIANYYIRELWNGDGTFLRFMNDLGQFNADAFLRNNEIIMNVGYLNYFMCNQDGTINLAGDSMLVRWQPDGGATADTNSDNHVVINIGEADSMAGLKDSRGTGFTYSHARGSFLLNILGEYRNPSTNNPSIVISNVSNSGLEKDNQVIIKGRFVSTGGAPVVSYSNTFFYAADIGGWHLKNCEFIQKVAGKATVTLGVAQTINNVYFDSCKLVNDGVTEIISHDATGQPMTVGFFNTVANSNLISPNIVQDGAITVNTNLSKYIKN